MKESAEIPHMDLPPVTARVELNAQCPACHMRAERIAFHGMEGAMEHYEAIHEQGRRVCAGVSRDGLGL